MGSAHDDILWYAQRKQRRDRIEPIAKIIRARCCRKADGRDLRDWEADEIAAAILEALDGDGK